MKTFVHCYQVLPLPLKCILDQVSKKNISIEINVLIFFVIRTLCKVNATLVTGFETTLFPVIQEILSNDVTGEYFLLCFKLMFPLNVRLHVSIS